MLAYLRKMTKKEIFWPLLIFIIALVLRLHNSSELFFWNIDEDRFALTAKRILIDHRPVLIGYSLPRDIYLGPIFPYILSFWYFLVGMNPFGLPVIAAILTAITAVLVFFFGKTIFESKRIGTIASLLYAFSSLAVVYSKVLTELTIAPIIALLTYLILYQNLKSKKPVNLIWLWVVLIVAVQNEGSSFSLLVLVAAVWLIYRFKIPIRKLAFLLIMMLHEAKLLQYILPELENGVGVKQNKHHVYTVFKHLMLSLKFCPSKDWRVRFATLLHDIAKPQTKKIISGDATFYNHDIVGAKVVNKIVTRLKFSKDDADKVVNLVRNHMFYYNVDEVTEAAVRRLLVKVGKENIKDLIDLRIGDRLGSGVPKAKPYKLRHLEYMIEKVSQDAISVKMLKINGDEMMKFLGIEPGPKIGAILDVLLSEVIENQDLNNKEYLEKRCKELNELNLQELRVKAREKIEEKKMEEDEELKKDFWVK